MFTAKYDALYGCQSKHRFNILQQNNTLAISWSFPDLNLINSIKEKYYKEGKWKVFNNKNINELKYFIKENISEEGKKRLFLNWEHFYSNDIDVEELDNPYIHHFENKNLLKFYKDLTLEEGNYQIICGMKTKDSKRFPLKEGYLVKIKSNDFKSVSQIEYNGKESFVEDKGPYICREIEIITKLPNDLYNSINKSIGRNTIITLKNEKQIKDIQALIDNI